MDSINVNDLKNQLIEQIKQYGVVDESVLEAFRFVPRHVFVPVFYDRVRVTSDKREWRRLSCVEMYDEWLEKVYTDRPLTILLDKDNYPNSSSSQPDLMALMMQSVKLRPGQRVLEIGTGTGYNAALIAHIVGAENVTTIDINAELLADAKKRIDQVVGPGVQVLHADGRHLPENIGTFDAIIVTGAHKKIETSWIRALVPGGRIIFNWNTSFIKAMIEAKKNPSGVEGNIAAFEGDFMGLHDGAGANHEMIPYERMEILTPHFHFQSQLNDPSFRFYLQIHKNEVVCTSYQKQHSDEKVYVVKEHERVIQVFPSQIRGDASLWREIKVLYDQYIDNGRPDPRSFLFSYKDDKMNFTLQVQEDREQIA